MSRDADAPSYRPFGLNAIAPLGWRNVCSGRELAVTMYAINQEYLTYRPRSSRVEQQEKLFQSPIIVTAAGDPPGAVNPEGVAVTGPAFEG